MTDSKIRAILTGLKGEIRRETDRERVRELCFMGMYWSRKLMTREFIERINVDNYFCSSGENVNEQSSIFE